MIPEYDKIIMDSAKESMVEFDLEKFKKSHYGLYKTMFKIVYDSQVDIRGWQTRCGNQQDEIENLKNLCMASLEGFTKLFNKLEHLDIPEVAEVAEKHINDIEKGLKDYPHLLPKIEKPNTFIVSIKPKALINRDIWYKPRYNVMEIRRFIVKEVKTKLEVYNVVGAKQFNIDDLYIVIEGENAGSIIVKEDCIVISPKTENDGKEG